MRLSASSPEDARTSFCPGGLRTASSASRLDVRSSTKRILAVASASSIRFTDALIFYPWPPAPRAEPQLRLLSRCAAVSLDHRRLRAFCPNTDQLHQLRFVDRFAYVVRRTRIHST